MISTPQIFFPPEIWRRKEKIKNPYRYLTDNENSQLSPDRPAIIEAMEEKFGNWDSDYVSNETMTIKEARQYLLILENDPNWEGWDLRIAAQDENGCYRLVLPD